MSYIAKSLKGKSIISNLDVEDSININCSIKTEQGSTYNIGSANETFKTLYIDEIIIILDQEPLTHTSATTPLNVSQGNISIALNPEHFSTTGNQLNSNINYNSPLSVSGGTVSLTVNPEHFTTAGNRLNSNVSYTSPLRYTNGNVSLTINSVDFNTQGGTLNSNIAYLSPLSNSGGVVRLSVNPQHFSTQNGQLNSNLTYTAPLSISNGNVKLSYSAPFYINNNKLDIKLKNSIDLSGNSLERLFITDDGELDVNVTDIIYAGNGIKKMTGTELFGLGLLDWVPGIDGQIPDVTYIAADIDTSQFDFKAGKISIKSQGLNRIPFYDPFSLTTDAGFTYSNVLKELKVGASEVSISQGYNTPRNHLTSKAYVDDLHGYADISALSYVQDGDSRIWRVEVDDNSIKIEEGKLVCKLLPVEGSCLTINPSFDIDLTVEPKHFQVVSNKLTSKLGTANGSCLVLDPDYNLDIAFEPTQFQVLSNKLKSKLDTKTGSCLVLDPDYNLDINDQLCESKDV